MMLVEELIVSVGELLANGRADEAVTALSGAVRRYKRSANVWKLYGHALSACGRDADAIDAYTESTFIIARDADIWVSMACAAHRLDRISDAATYWKSALEANPSLFRQRPELGTLWRECRSANYDGIVARLVRRKDPPAAGLLLDEIAMVEQIESVIAAIDRAGSLSPPLCLARATLKLAMAEEHTVDDFAGVIRTHEIDNVTLTSCVRKAIHLSDTGRAELTTRLAGSGGKLTRIAYLLAEDEESLFVALGSMSRSGTAAAHSIAALVA